MKHLLFLIGIMTVLSQAHGSRVDEVIEGKLHDTHEICNSELNWAVIAHPHDCHKFYVCANYIPEEFSCAENYFFDPQQRRCILGSCSEVKECHSWVRRVEEDCRAFETCQNGNYVRDYCSRDSFFIGAQAICAPISNTPEHKCSCILPPNSVLANPSSCETYYACIDGQAVLHECPYGMYFDTFLNTCLVDLHGKCLIPLPMTPEENEMLEICERIDLSDEDSTNAGRLIFQPDDQDCRKFYICTNGRVISKYCPQGFFYNRELQFCEVDTDGRACETIREQAKNKKEEKEREASIKKEERENKVSIKKEEQHHEFKFQHQHEAIDHKPPVKLSLSLTHETDIKHTGSETIKMGQGHSSIELISPIHIAPHPETNHVEEQEMKEVINDEEMDNNSAEVQEINSVEMKLPPLKLKLPTHSTYDKLASKFMLF